MRFPISFALLASFLVSSIPQYGEASCSECGKIYSLQSDKNVVEIDLSTGDSKKVVTLGYNPNGAAMTGSGDFFVADFGKLNQVDLCTGATNVIPYQNGMLRAIGSHPDSDLLFGLRTELLTFDPSVSGVSTFGPGGWCGAMSGDLLYNPGDGLIYASHDCGSLQCGGDTLVRVNPKTGTLLDEVGCFTLDGNSVSQINGFAFDYIGRAIAGTRTSSDVFVVNLETAELTRIAITGDYTGTVGFGSFPCPSKSQDLKFNLLTNELGLTDSDITINLSSLVNNGSDEIQELGLLNNELSLTKSHSRINLSHLDNHVPQELKINPLTKSLGLTGSFHPDVDLSSLAQDLSMNGNRLEISNGAGLDLTSIRVTSLQATIEDIDGDDANNGSRKLRKKQASHRILHGNNGPTVKYGGDAKSGFVMIRDSRLLGFTVSADEKLKSGSGSLQILALECTDMDNAQVLGAPADVLSLGPREARNKRMEFESPIPVNAGSAVCFQVTRVGKVDSEGGGNNVASLVLMMETL